MFLRHKFPTEVQKWIVGKRIPKDEETLQRLRVTHGQTVFLYLVSAKSVGLDKKQHMAASGRSVLLNNIIFKGLLGNTCSCIKKKFSYFPPKKAIIVDNGLYTITSKNNGRGPMIFICHANTVQESSYLCVCQLVCHLITFLEVQLLLNCSRKFDQISKED